MITGGFDRKLDADQIVLYRDDWVASVARQRGREAAFEETEMALERQDLSLAMNLAEMYREAKAYDKLAIHYHIMGNDELRDKYIRLSLRHDTSDDNITFLRGLQGRPDLIPQKVIQRQLAERSRQQAWHNRARLLHTVGRSLEAARDYIKGISRSLEIKNHFSAAFYLKEIAQSAIIDDLFEEALAEARAENDLWWQVRALQELGRPEDINKLMIEHSREIEQMNEHEDTFLAAELKRLLARARGDRAAEANYQRQGEEFLLGSRGKRRSKKTN